jgi:predicted nucleic acid-binding protein
VTAFVLDSSITFSWFFENERTASGDRLLDRLETEAAGVPALWYVEVANVLAMRQRQKRITAARVAEFVTQLETLVIVGDAEAPARAFGRILDLARAEHLTAYDAAYLELAMRLGVPLATKDQELGEAAERLGVEVLWAT